MGTRLLIMVTVPCAKSEYKGRLVIAGSVVIADCLIWPDFTITMGGRTFLKYCDNFSNKSERCHNSYCQLFDFLKLLWSYS